MFRVTTGQDYSMHFSVHFNVSNTNRQAGNYLIEIHDFMILHNPLTIAHNRLYILRPHTIDNVGNAVHQGEGKCQIANNTKAQQYG